MDYKKNNTNKKSDMSSDYARTKPQYRCAICNTAYDEIEDRTKCEQTCLKKQAEERKKRQQEALSAKKDERYKELCDAISKTSELYRKYLKDYGSFYYGDDSTNSIGSSYLNSLNKILGWF